MRLKRLRIIDFQTNWLFLKIERNHFLQYAMKKSIFLALVFVIGAIGAHAGVIVLEGEYQLRNIYVLNGKSGSGVGFCTFEVTVNGQVTSDEINSEAFEIDLSIYGFEMGDDVIVKIKHKPDCEPNVINSGALQPLPTFEVKNITIGDDEILHWTTTNEQGSLPFIIQQKKWNKWVKVGEVEGKGTSGTNQYEFKVPTVSGRNEYRVAQKSYDAENRVSESVSLISNKPAVTYDYDQKNEQIKFSNETSFEVYNVYGQIVKRGYGEEVDISNLSKNTYYLTYDGSSDEFVKR